jgi:hypothetical protein
MAGGIGRAWPPGRYVIEVASGTAAYRRWLGIEIVDLAPLRVRSPAPAGTPPSVVPSPSGAGGAAPSATAPTP